MRVFFGALQVFFLLTAFLTDQKFKHACCHSIIEHFVSSGSVTRCAWKDVLGAGSVI
jgi:hypothetical protein